MKNRLDKLQTDYNKLQEVLNRSDRTRRFEGYVHHRAIEEANTKIKSPKELLDERDENSKNATVS